MKEVITIKVYDATEREAWDGFLDNALNGHFMFKRGFMEYHQDQFQDYSLLFFKGQQLMAVLPGNIDGDVYWSHQGLSFGGFVYKKYIRHFEVEAVFSAFLNFCRQKEITSFCYKQMPGIYFSQFFQPDSFVLHQKGFSCIRKDLSTILLLRDYPNGRNTNRTRLLKKSLKIGMEISETIDFEETWQLLSYRLEEKYGVQPVHSIAEITLLQKKFPDHIICKELRDSNGALLASAVLFVEHPVVHLQYMTTSEVGRKQNGLDLIIHHVIEVFRSQYTYLSFGVSTESEGTVVNESLLRYKESWGGVPITHDFYQLKIID